MLPTWMYDDLPGSRISAVSTRELLVPRASRLEEESFLYKKVQFRLAFALKANCFEYANYIDNMSNRVVIHILPKK